MSRISLAAVASVVAVLALLAWAKLAGACPPRACTWGVVSVYGAIYAAVGLGVAWVLRDASPA